MPQRILLKRFPSEEMKHLFQSILLLVLILGLAGCVSSGLPPDAGTEAVVSPLLARAEALFRQENYTEAMIECINLARKDPLMPGLPELQNRIVTKLAEKRAKAATLRAEPTHRRMKVDIDKRKAIPDTYGILRAIRGETEPMLQAPTPMELVLQKKVTVHLDSVNLDDFIMAIGASENVNIIADSLDTTSTMTIHAEDVPLSEILDYVSRNLGVAFYIGENIVWATPRDEEQSGIPMNTRMYRLRKGISSEELEAGEEGINIVEAIQRFIPEIEGSDLLFDKKAHVLIVKNTMENLAKVERIIENLDVCPPQVLIEARFISTAVSDLRELGIDWILNSPIAVTRKRVLRNGVEIKATKTRIDPTSPETIIGFSPFPGLAQGLNLSYQGLLTDPMFRAVLHALETSGKSRTLSVPKITTVNNRPASIRIGEDFRYFEEYDIQSVPSDISSEGRTIYSTVLVPVGTPSIEELGIELNVTPSVGADMSTITLSMVPEISEFVRYEHYEVGSRRGYGDTTQATTNGAATSLVKLPIFRRSKIETEVIVQSGETVVMGGLISSSESKKTDGVPFLSSIPLIGRLFRHDGVEEVEQNLLIFVTATILSERGENLIPIMEE